MFEYFTPESINDQYSQDQDDNFLEKEVIRVADIWKEKGSDNPVKSALSTVFENIKKDSSNYLRYSLYWWEVKRLLIEHGFMDSNLLDDDESVRQIYKGKTDMETIILASVFANYYIQTYLKGTRDMDINGEDSYRLFDDDMELI